jgi:hypothetical protein
MMKVALLAGFTLILLSVKTASAQTNITDDYVVTATGDVVDQTAYLAAMDAANWEPFRLQNERFQMSFENGYTVELKSAIEMLNLGYPLNLASYQTNYPAGMAHPTLELFPNHIIGIKVQNAPSKYQ